MADVEPDDLALHAVPEPVQAIERTETTDALRVKVVPDRRRRAVNVPVGRMGVTLANRRTEEWPRLVPPHSTGQGTPEV